MGRTKNTQKSTKEVASSSTEPPPPPPVSSYDATRFKTLAAYFRYKRDESEKPAAERGIYFVEWDELRFALYNDQRDVQQWEEFVKEPGKANIHVVREFYANLPDSTTDEVMVRNHKVKYDPETINALFGLTNEDGPHDFIQKEDQPSRSEQVQAVCDAPGFVFDPSKPVYEQVKPSFLNFECRIWMWFICSNLIPTKSGRELTLDRLWALYCIVNGLKINVGKVINQQIRNAAFADPAHIFFPQTIWSLCYQAGVRERRGDLEIKPKSIINYALLTKGQPKRSAKKAQQQPHETDVNNQEQNAPPNLSENPNEQPPAWFVDSMRHINQRFDEIKETIQNGPPPAWFVDSMRYNKECYNEIKAMIRNEPPPPVTPWAYDTQPAYYPRFDDEQPNINQGTEAIDPANFTFDPNTIPGFGDGFEFGGTSGANNDNNED